MLKTEGVRDCGQAMRLIRACRGAAARLGQLAPRQGERDRLPLCRPKPVVGAFVSARLRDVDVLAIDIDTTFSDLDDDWTPLLAE